VSNLSSYHKRLFVFLSVATFFEGYDFMALSQVLPNIQSEMGLSEAALGNLVGVISAGTIVSYVLIRMADKWGRRRVLTITILGYALLTLMTATSRGPVDFAIYQFTARIFLIAEWALCMVYAAEEFPADQRGFVLGLIQAFNSLGSITCAVVAPLLLATPLGWRSVYLVGVIPLLLIAYARRGIRETKRFEELQQARAGKTHSMFAIMRSPYRTRVLQLALIWGLTYLCTNTAVLFWKQFTVTERGFTDADVGKAIALASVGALPFVFSIGKLLDKWGRRKGAVLIYVICGVSVVLTYQLHNFWLLTASLMWAIFGAIALLSLLNVYTTELFPTDMRADAFAWANNLLGRIGYVLAPVLVGRAAARIGWGNAVSLTAIAVLMALILILWFLPETAGRELEETSAV